MYPDFIPYVQPPRTPTTLDRTPQRNPQCVVMRVASVAARVVGGGKGGGVRVVGRVGGGGEVFEALA